ncbi:MAG: hypothetical protein KGM44_11965 [bacterium]|nr:hypothetical protein [bacterium]
MDYPLDTEVYAQIARERQAEIRRTFCEARQTAVPWGLTLARLLNAAGAAGDRAYREITACR